MELKTYMRGMAPEHREDFARRCETSVNYLKLVAYKAKRPGEKLCILIDRESAGVVRCEDLRPDVDWAYLRRAEGVPKDEQEVA